MGHSRPLAIDLFTGLHGWAEGLVAEGFDVVGFDIEDMCGQFGQPRPVGVQLVLQDVMTIHGKQFKDVDLIVASPPCQEYSYMAMPWKRAKQIRHEYKTGVRDVKKLTALFDACFRIQREACEAAGRHIPMVVENVRGAQEWVGRSRFAYGSFHLWGDVPALMPVSRKAGVKRPGMNWSGSDKPGYVAKAFNDTNGIKNTGGSWFNVAHNTTSGKGNNPDGRKSATGGSWFGDNKGGQRATGSKSKARKRYAAMIAKIPFALSSHIARVYRPQRVAA